MVTGTALRTPYQIRLELVRDTVTMYSLLLTTRLRANSRSTYWMR